MKEAQRGEATRQRVHSEQVAQQEPDPRVCKAAQPARGKCRPQDLGVQHWGFPWAGVRVQGGKHLYQDGACYERGQCLK